MTDFEKYYNEQKEYIEFRNNEEKRNEYKLRVDWKIRNLINVIPSNYKFNNILEVGCAFGLLLNELSGNLKINDAYGIDISGENIEIAQKIYPHIKFIKGTIENIDFRNLAIANNKFDLVILSDIVEHIPDDLDFIQKVSKITKFILLNLPLEKSLVNKNRKYGIEDRSGHLRCYDYHSAINLISKSGLTIVESKCENTLKDRSISKLFNTQQKIRVSKKPFLKKIFWTITYFLYDIFIKPFPNLHKRVFGHNLFCLIKTDL